MENESGLTKRGFLQSIGAALPTLQLLSAGEAAPRPAGGAASGKFTPVDCSPHFTAAPADLSPGQPLRMPSGQRELRGIPFALGPEGSSSKSWMVLSRRQASWTHPAVEIPLHGKAGFVCLAQFCERDPSESPAPGSHALERAGQTLADLVLLYEDGTRHVHPIRRRFEVNSPSGVWGHLSFASVTHRKESPRKLTDPLRSGRDWGNLQMGLWDADYADAANEGTGLLWLSAIANPFPDRTLKAVRFESRSDDALVVCGVTLFHGGENPLRYERLSLYRIAIPEGPAERWHVDVDLGVVARTFQLPPFDAEAFLSSAVKGLGETRQAPGAAAPLYAEITASTEAILTLRDARTGREYRFDMGRAMSGEEIAAQPAGPRVEVVERDRVWVRGKVVDAATGRPTPVRLALRSSQGRYIPPYGHRTEINNAWFSDYGADLQWGASSFSYTDGTFQVELPVGEVYVEVTKGFEYEPIRRKLDIRAGQGELNLEVARFADLRAKRWASADTHVHFLSPSTAVLEAQGEGVNLVNLLAAQWGDLFTNVGDLAHGPLTSRDGETIVWVGTENRQHLLGHLGLLGGRGEPVFPMSAGGPHESYIGGPLWNTLSDWADRCREREGLVVAVHFPYPTAELAADIALNKIDAVELWPVNMGEQFNNLRFQEWYRYLNCGYRLPAVAGTDKMGAWIPVGAHRAYAYLGDDEFTFANWAKAVRKGNTFMSSGPLLFFAADGHAPGGEIALRSGAVEVHAEVQSATPVHRLEIVWNGDVVASREERSGTRRMDLKETIRVTGPGWLAARCGSRFLSAGTRIAAHTSPVYVVTPGRELFSPEVAAYMLTLIEGAEYWAQNLAVRPDAQRFARALKVFRDAREEVHRRLHQHGIRHP